MIDLLSLISVPEVIPTVPPDSSAPAGMDFSALLEQLFAQAGPGGSGVRPGAGDASPVPVEPWRRAPEDPLASVAEVPEAVPDSHAPEPARDVAPEKPERTPAAPWDPGFAVAVASALTAALQSSPAAPEQIQPAAAAAASTPVPHAEAGPIDKPGKRVDDAPAAVPLALPAIHAMRLSEASPESLILADVKKFDVTLERIPLKPAEVPGAEPPARALVTTDPILNLRQLQLPLRLISVQKVSAADRPQDRAKPAGTTPEPNDHTSPALVPQVADPAAPLDTAEQSRPAQLIEIPDMPKLQVVRTVSIEVGDEGSQVAIHIADRGDGMALQLGASSETLHRTLESSVGSLVHTLKQEQIHISNVEVTRKSPIDKVRRMKEAH